jgi:hypothetical protein
VVPGIPVGVRKLTPTREAYRKIPRSQSLVGIVNTSNGSCRTRPDVAIKAIPKALARLFEIEIRLKPHPESF